MGAGLVGRTHAGSDGGEDIVEFHQKRRTLPEGPHVAADLECATKDGVVGTAGTARYGGGRLHIAGEDHIRRRMAALDDPAPSCHDDVMIEPARDPVLEDQVDVGQKLTRLWGLQGRRQGVIHRRHPLMAPELHPVTLGRGDTTEAPPDHRYRVAVFEPDDELPHPPDEPGIPFDEMWHFDAWTDDGSIGAFVRIGREWAPDRTWYWAGLVRPGEAEPLALVLDPGVPFAPDGRLEIRSEGVWADHVCESPFVHWSFGLEAYAVGLDDPAEALGRMFGSRLPLGFDLEWETIAGEAPVPSGDTTPPTGGYAHSGRGHGEILIGSEELILEGWGHRRHHWGLAPLLSPSWTLCGRLTDGTSIEWAGDLAGVAPDTTDSDRFPSRLVLTTTTGTAICTVLGWAPLRHTARFGDVIVGRCLTRFDVDGAQGIGWFEATPHPWAGSD